MELFDQAKSARPRSKCPHNVYQSASPGLIVKLFPGYTPDFIHPRIHSSLYKDAIKQDAVDIGIPDFYVAYSINKHKRWKLCQIFADEVERLQDKHKHLRRSLVSYSKMRPNDLSTFEVEDACNVHKTSWECFGVTEYHDVDNDGHAIHRYGKGALTKLRDLTTKEKPKKNRSGKYKKWLAENPVDYYPAVSSEDDVTHVQYSVVEHRKASRSIVDSAWRNPRCNWYRSRKRRQSFNMTEFVQEDLQAYKDELECNILEEEDEDAAFRITLNDCILQKRRKGKKQKIKEKMRVPFNPRSPKAKQPTTIPEPEPEPMFLLKSHEVPLAVTNDALDALAVCVGDVLPVYPTSRIVHITEARKHLSTALNHCVLVKDDQVSRSCYLIERCTCSTGRSLCSFGWNCQTPSQLEIEPTTSDADLKPVEFSTSGGLCAVCCATSSSSSMFALSCGHLYCVECWMNHVNEQMAIGSAPVSCMTPKCKMSLSISASRALLETKSFDVYRNAVYKNMLADPSTISCPSCSRILIPSPSTPDSDSDWLVLGAPTCVCGVTVCLACRNISHRPLTCLQFAEYKNMLDSSGFSLKFRLQAPFVLNALRRCPLCSVLASIEVPEYRLDVACPVCCGRWCRTCGREWTRNQHYYCNVKDSLADALIMNGSEFLSRRSFVDVLTRRKELHLLGLQYMKGMKAHGCNGIERRKAKGILEQAFLLAEFGLASQARNTGKANVNLDRLLFAVFRLLATDYGNAEHKMDFLRHVTDGFDGSAQNIASCEIVE